MFLSENLRPKIPNLRLEIPRFMEVGAKLNFSAPSCLSVICTLSVGKLQLSVCSNFEPRTSLGVVYIGSNSYCKGALHTSIMTVRIKKIIS